MIQRYNLKSIYWVDTDTQTSRVSKEFEKNDKGEWVKWEDVQKLNEENKRLREHILSTQEHIHNIADMANRGLIHYGT